MLEWEAGLATLSSLSPVPQFPPKIQSDPEGEDFGVAAGLQGGTAPRLGAPRHEQRVG